MANRNIQVYYSAREIQVSEGETAMLLVAELGEAEAGSGNAQALIDRIVTSGRGLECVAAESDVARSLEIGDLVDVDSGGMVRCPSK